MEDLTQLEMGSKVSCRDGMCGELRRVVADPLSRAVTHLVVEAKHRQGLGRLVPIELVAATSPEVCLGCTVAEFEGLEHAEESRFLPGSAGEGDYPADTVLYLPYYGPMEGMGANANESQPAAHDKVPVGEVEVRRGDQVHASDGDIGRVKGLLIDPRDHHITHVLLQEGHLWGRHEVAIPISSVAAVDDGVVLKISKDEVQALPAVGVSPWST
ncbi:MAG: PRC-barrel domain-containing protein [Acidimicrobiales bacterium]